MNDATSFDDLDELERIVRESGWASTKPQTLTSEEQRIAAKLMGKTDAKRLANLKPGQGFKYRPVRTLRVEFYFRRAFYAGWTLEGVETTGRRIVAESLDDGSAAAQIAELRARGYCCQLVVTEPMRAWGIVSEPALRIPNKRAEGVSFSGRPIAQSRPGRSKAFELLQELRGFKR